MGTNLTSDEVARLRMKAKRGTLTTEERALYESYEAEHRVHPQVEAESILQCPCCGHASIGVQIVSDVTQRNPRTVMAMMFAPLIIVLVGFLVTALSRNGIPFLFAWVCLIFAMLIPLWVFYRGQHSVTHRYYVCKRCGYVERDEKWKIANNGGDTVMAIAGSIGVAVVLIIALLMAVASFKPAQLPSVNNPSIEDSGTPSDGGSDLFDWGLFDSQNGGTQTIEDLGNGTILINE